VDTTLFDAVEAGVYRRAPFLQSRSAQVRPLVWAALVRLDPGAFVPHLRLLQTIAKGQGKTSKQNMGVFGDVLTLLGLTWEARVGAARIGDTDQLEAPLRAYTNCDYVGGYSGVKEPKELWFNTKTEAEEGRQALLANVEIVSEDGPEQPELGKFYVWGVGSPYLDPRLDPRTSIRWIVSTKYWWVGAPVWVVSGADGKAHTIALPSDLKGRRKDTDELSVPSLWTWLYKNNAQERAASFLANVGVDVAKQATERRVRDTKGTGTCQCCFKNVKLTQRKAIFRHGWQVWGSRAWDAVYHSRACWGVGYLPFELSKDRTEAYIEWTKRDRVQIEQRLPPLIADVEAATQRAKASKNDKDWVEVYRARRALEDVQYHLESVTNWLTAAQAAVRNWTARPEALK